jgi:hypothetical protein
VLLLREFPVFISPIFQKDPVFVTDQRLSGHFFETATPDPSNRVLKVGQKVTFSHLFGWISPTSCEKKFQKISEIEKPFLNNFVRYNFS